MMRIMDRRPVAACLVALALALAAPARSGAQGPASRLIDTEPKVVIRPPGAEGRDVTPDPRRAPPSDDRATERDRGLDLELEMEARREKRDAGSGNPSWLAAAVFVGAGAVLLVLLAVALRRGER
jgi:hypothetical protein